MKEKIIEILQEREYYNELYRPFFPAIVEQFKPLIDAEVERRIAERMPSDVVSSNAALDYCAYPDIDGEPQFNEAEGRGFQAGIEWLRSRLTNPGVIDSQKTEGGGE